MVVLQKERSVWGAAEFLLRSAAVAEGSWSMVVVQLMVVKRIILGFILLCDVALVVVIQKVLCYADVTVGETGGKGCGS